MSKVKFTAKHGIDPDSLPSSNSGARFTVSTASVSNGTLTLNASTSSFFEVLLDGDITSLILTGVTAGEITEITVNFRQDATGNWVVKLPTNVIPAIGDAAVVATSANDRTVGKFTTYDNGTTWLYTVLQTYAPTGSFVLPTFDENAVFNNEGTSLSGWTNTGFNLTQQTASIVRLTNPTNAWANAITPISGLATNRDTLFYGRIRAKKASGIANFFLRSSDNLKFVSIRFNYNSDTSATEFGAVSFSATSGGSNTENKALLGSRFSNFDTDWFDFLIHIDANFGSAALYIRHPGPTSWGLAARVPCTPFPIQEILILSVPVEIGHWFEYDHLTLCKPNLMSIGDSICAGNPRYEPNLSAEDSNYIGSWQPHCRIYPKMRNNFIVNKGISGETSTQIDSRIASYITINQPRLTFLHASTNDPWQLSQSTRTTNIQSSINKIVAASGACVLLAAMVGNQETVVNTPFMNYHDYFKKWEKDSLPGITGLLGYVDIVQAVRNRFNDYQSFDFADDPVHPNIKGHSRIGALITSVARVS